MAPAPSITVKFDFDKETTGTARFKEVGDNIVIGTLYVKKVSWAELGSPKALEVKVTAGS